MKWWWLPLLLLALAGCGPKPYQDVDSAGLKALLEQGVPLFDVRRRDEWMQTGIVAGSHTLTFIDDNDRINPLFMARFEREVAKDAPVALICRTGNRTEALARELARMGYTQVYNVSDGITRWIRDGHPVIRP